MGSGSRNFRFLMEDGFMGGCTYPLRTFLIFDFVLQDTKKIVCQCYQNYLKRLLSKIFIWKLFPWDPKGIPPINLEVFFSDILATASRLNILYGLGNLFIQSSRYVRIIKKILGIFDTFDVFTTSSMYPTFYVILVLLYCWSW